MLDLNEDLKFEKIKFGDKEFKVPCELPVDFMIEHHIDDIDKKDIETQINETKKYIKDVLYLENDKNEVNTFIDKLSFQKIIKVSVFITNFLNEYAKSDTVVKKNDL